MPAIKYMVQMEQIVKLFNNNYALNKVGFKVRPQTIHALIGENGSGKSTLMSILYGLYEPESGTIKINDHTVHINNPQKANALGISLVQQSFQLVENLAVWKNIVFGHETTIGGLFLNKKRIFTELQALMDLYELKINLHKKVSQLTVGQKQIVEILKVLYLNNDLLIFDEPTSILNQLEVQSFLALVQRLKKQGKTIIFISHHFQELQAVCDYATVIRQGEVQGEFNMRQTTKQALISAMIGENLKKVTKQKDTVQKEKTPVLHLQNIAYAKKNAVSLHNLNLQVYRGEIVGIAGIAGNGQTELVQILLGTQKPNAGFVFQHETDITMQKWHQRTKIAYIPEDRHQDAVLLDWNIINNVNLRNINSQLLSKWGFCNQRAMLRSCDKVIENYDVHNANKGYAIMRNLSGGNQQKVVLGRELMTEHDLVIAVQPTMGLDLKAVNFIHEQLFADCAKGGAILIISYDIKELLTLCDRIFVMKEGQFIAELQAKQTSAQEIGSYMLEDMKKKERAHVN